MSRGDVSGVVERAVEAVGVMGVTESGSTNSGKKISSQLSSEISIRR